MIKSKSISLVLIRRKFAGSIHNIPLNQSLIHDADEDGYTKFSAKLPYIERSYLNFHSQRTLVKQALPLSLKTGSLLLKLRQIVNFKLKPMLILPFCKF